MGIHGLLTILKPVTIPTHISNYRKKRIAIDSYGWIHKATFGCSIELCTGSAPLKWIQYCLSYIDMLLSFDVIVYLVFDGSNLPAKSSTETDRLEKRKQNLEQGWSCLNRGDKNGARNFFAKAIDVTPRMAAELIHICRSTRPSVKCVVAPYEADAQLTYMSLNKIVDVVVSEDADMIPFGCREVLFKLDREGNCQRILTSDVYNCPPETWKTGGVNGVDMSDFTPDMMTTMCIISGCDYLASPEGTGIKTSYKYVKKHRSADKVLRALRLQGLLPMELVAPVDGQTSCPSCLVYELGFYKAQLTFRHQTVFDPVTRKTVPLTPLDVAELPACVRNCCRDPHGNVDLSFMGHPLDDELACGVADGLVDPNTQCAPMPPQLMHRSHSLTHQLSAHIHSHFPSTQALSRSQSATISPPNRSTLPENRIAQQPSFEQSKKIESAFFLTKGSVAAAHELAAPKDTILAYAYKTAANKIYSDSENQGNLPSKTLPVSSITPGELKRSPLSHLQSSAAKNKSAISRFFTPNPALSIQLPDQTAKQVRPVHVPTMGTSTTMTTSGTSSVVGSRPPVPALANKRPHSSTVPPALPSGRKTAALDGGSTLKRARSSGPGVVGDSIAVGIGIGGSATISKYFSSTTSAGVAFLKPSLTQLSIDRLRETRRQQACERLRLVEQSASRPDPDLETALLQSALWERDRWEIGSRDRPISLDSDDKGIPGCAVDVYVDTGSSPDNSARSVSPKSAPTDETSGDGVSRKCPSDTLTATLLLRPVSVTAQPSPTRFVQAGNGAPGSSVVNAEAVAGALRRSPRTRSPSFSGSVAVGKVMSLSSFVYSFEEDEEELRNHSPASETTPTTTSSPMAEASETLVSNTARDAMLEGEAPAAASASASSAPEIDVPSNGTEVSATRTYNSVSLDKFALVECGTPRHLNGDDGDTGLHSTANKAVVRSNIRKKAKPVARNGSKKKR